jgi:hypothetical protein
MEDAKPQRKYDLTSQPILVSLSAGMGGTVDLLGIKSLTDLSRHWMYPQAKMRIRMPQVCKSQPDPT